MTTYAVEVKTKGITKWSNLSTYTTLRSARQRIAVGTVTCASGVKFRVCRVTSTVVKPHEVR